MCPLRDAPLPGVPIEARQQPGIGHELYTTRLAGAQRDALEPEQAHARLAGRLGQVELGHIGALALAGVGHRKARRHRLPAVDLQIPIVKLRVAQPIAKGIERPGAGLGEPAVADLGALSIVNRQRRAPRVAKSRQLGTRRLGDIGLEGDR